MKRLLFIVALFATLVTKAQYPIVTERAQLIGAPTTAVRAQGTFYVDSLLYLPLNLNVNLARLYRPGALFYQISDSSLYAWTGSQFWRIGGGEGGPGSPTNLSVTRTANTMVITNSNGTNAVVPLSDGIDAGVLSAADWQRFNNKLDVVNLGVNRTATGVTVTNNAGSEAVIPLGDATFAGLVPPAKYQEWNNKLSSISTRYSIANNGSSAAPLQLVNDLAAPGANMVYGTTAAGTKGWKSDPGGVGGASEVVRLTYAALDASSGLATDKLYWVTDQGRAGPFEYVGTVANQTSDNGGTIVVNAGLQQFRRVYSGPIFIEWFGVREDATDPGTTVKSANVAGIRSAIATAKTYERVTAHPTGSNAATAVWLNDSILMRSTFDKKHNVNFDGKTFRFTHNGNGFVIESTLNNFTNNGGRILGPGLGATDSTTFSAYTGVGVLMRNLYNSNVEVWEVEGWNVGVEMRGEAWGGVGTTANGSQYNTVRVHWPHHNYIQVKLATYGPAGTAGNWNNESFWYFSQLGRGFDDNPNGPGGTFGMVITKDATSTAVTYGINGHSFYNMGFEGVKHGLVADNTENNTWYHAAFEPAAMTYHINLDPTTAIGNKFVGGPSMGDYYFVEGRKGVRTQIVGRDISGKTASGTHSGVAQAAITLPTSPSMTGITLAPQTMMFSSDYFQGFTALEALNNLNHWHWMKLSQYPSIINGWMKYNGEFRGGMYKPTYLAIGAVTGPAVTAPPNLGYIRFEGDEATVVTLNDGDDIQHSRYFESFKVEYNTTQPLTIQNAQGTTVVNSSNFSATGMYEIVWRSGVWVVKSLSGGGAGNVVPVAVGGTPNANGFTYNSSNGNLQLTPASATQPGVISLGNQSLGTGIKSAEEFKAPAITLQDDVNGYGAYQIRRRANGLTFADPNVPNPSATDLTYALFGSGSSARNMALFLGKTATNSNGIGNNGTDLLYFGEKSTGGFEWRNGVGFSTFSLGGGNLRGKIFGNGNWLIQSGGTPTDAGYKLDVQGTQRVTGAVTLSGIAAPVGSTYVVTVDEFGILGSKVENTGTSGGSSIFTLGGGTRNSYYRSAGPVNIGVNPAESWAWTHWGASCNTCGPGSTQRAIWEFLSTSTIPSTPRPNSMSYNGAVWVWTPNNGIPGEMLTSTNAATIGGAKSYEALDINPQYIDPLTSAEGDNLVSNGTDGTEYRAPNYEMKASYAGSGLAVTSLSSTSVLSTTLESIPIGSQIEYTATGVMSVCVSDQPNFNFTLGGVTQLVQFPAFPVLTSRYFEMKVTFTKRNTGFAMTAKIEIDNGTLTIHELVHNETTTALPTSGTLQATFDWDNQNGTTFCNTITFNTAKFEIFRNQ
jgi:hypothetical protein